MVVFGIIKSGTGVSSIIIIIICSIGLICIGGPLVGFLGFHCFIMITGKDILTQRKDNTRDFEKD
jgi:hypothetical protein